MQKIFFINNLLLVIMLCGQAGVAQSNDTLITGRDSIIIVKQLVKEQLSLQLQQSGIYKKMQQHQLAALLKDSTASDSLSKLVLQEMQQLKQQGISTGKTLITDAGHTARQLLQQQFAMAMQTQQVKNIFSQFTDILKQPVIQWQSGSVYIAGQTAPSLFNTETVFTNNSTVNSSWSVLGIPVGLQFTRQDFAGPAYNTRTVISFRFDREAYLNSLREKIKLHIKASDLLPDYNDALKKIEQTAVAGLRASLDSIDTSCKGMLKKQLQSLGDPKDLLKGDLNALQDKLLSPLFLQTIENNNSQLAQLQQQLNAGGKINTQLYDSLVQAVQAVNGVHAIVNKIQSFKETLQKSGLLEKLQQAEQFKTSSVQRWLQDPDKIKSLAKEQLAVNGLQQLFLNINRLQAGMNNINLSKLTLYQYGNNGVNAEFVNNKTYLFVMAGSNKEFSGLYDNRFTGSSLPATVNSAMGVRVGRGDLQSSYAHFSLFTFKQHNSGYENNIVGSVPGKTMVVTFSNQLKINQANYVNLEISKSAHAYDNQKSSYDTLMQGSSLSKQLLAGGNFMQQLAFTLQWIGEIKDKGLSYDVNGTRIGRGYTNPGNLFLSAGMTEIGGSIKKSFLESRLQLSARGNYRGYAYSINHAAYRNYNFSFLAKWKLKKGQYVSLRYQPYQSLKWQDDRKISIGGSSRLSLDMGIRRRFGNINYQHIITLAAVKNNYNFDTLPFTNNAVLISSTQTFTINKQSYYFNLQYNKAIEPAALALFNTQFTCDAGFVYNLGKTMVASTAINYNSTKDWVQQVGIKQSISGRLGEKMTVSLYTAIFIPVKEYRPGNIYNTTVNWSLQYLLK